MAGAGATLCAVDSILIAGLLWARSAGFVFSVIGSTLLLYLYRRFVQHRPLTGPGARELPPR